MNESKPQVSRLLVAIIAATCLLAALVLWIWWPENPFWYGSFFRVGILMAVFYIALPTRTRAAAWARISPWALVGIALAAILIPRMKPMMIPVLIVVAVALIFLRPRKRRAPPPGP